MTKVKQYFIYKKTYSKLIPHFIKSNHTHYLDYYDQETLDLVYERFSQDFERFNYEKITL